MSHCLNSDIINIWDFDKRKLKESLNGKGSLKKVQFYKYDDSIWAVEDEKRVVNWKKEVSIDNNYGFTWNRIFEIEIPSDYCENLFILDAIYNIHIGKFFTFILVKEGKDDNRAELMYYKHEYSSKYEDALYFKAYKTYYEPKFKYLEFLNGQLAVISDERITIIRPEESEKKLDGRDADFYVSMDCDVFVTATKRVFKKVCHRLRNNSLL